jgi:hypothetical protein
MLVAEHGGDGGESRGSRRAPSSDILSVPGERLLDLRSHLFARDMPNRRVQQELLHALEDKQSSSPSTKRAGD